MKFELEYHKPRIVYAFQNTAEIVKASSSGGAFSWLAENVFQKGGRVFATSLDVERREARVEECRGAEELNRFRTSKYFQSKVGESYLQIQKKLDAHEMILFAGTPCQVAGLKAFLQKDYENLVTVDFVCHGVPSRRCFQYYIAYLERTFRAKVTGFSFRGKDKFGWKIANRITFNNQKMVHVLSKYDYYWRIYHSGANYRECCYECRYASTERVSDITLCDYWGVYKYHKNINCDYGVSAILVNTESGRKLVEDCEKSDILLVESQLENVVKNQGLLSHAVTRNPMRDSFYHDLDKMDFSSLAEKYTGRSHFVINSLLNTIPAGILILLGRCKNYYNMVRDLRK